jgi:hypothetical protein
MIRWGSSVSTVEEIEKEIKRQLKQGKLPIIVWPRGEIGGDGTTRTRMELEAIDEYLKSIRRRSSGSSGRVPFR